MAEENSKTIIFIILVIAGIWLWQNHKTITDLKSQVEEYQNEADDYRYALNEANSNIEEANSYIEDAQSYAWSSYDEMGWALDNLSTVDTVQP